MATRTIGATLRTLRERAGVTRSALARKIGVDPAALYQLETKGANPSFVLVVKIARALALPLDAVADAALGKAVVLQAQADPVLLSEALDEIERSTKAIRESVARVRGNAEPSPRKPRGR